MKNKNPDKPWVASFSSVIKPIVSKDKDKMLSEASINKLKSFIPEIDMSRNSDLVPIAFNSYVVNRVNANDDLVSTDTAIQMRDHFINKPINIEHNRNHIVGCILKSGFSKFGSDEPFEEDQLLDFLIEYGQYAPFNSTLGGVLWKVAGEEIASFVEEASDPSSEFYNSVSASWEVEFSEFHILTLPVGAKNYDEGTVITDDSKIEKMMGSLRGFGGSGEHGGQRIYRLIVGDVTPLGVGLTENPAADVKGILTKKSGLESMVEDMNEEKEEEDEDDAKCDKYKKASTDLIAEQFGEDGKILVSENGIIKVVDLKDIKESESIAEIKQKTVKDNKDTFNTIMKIKNLTDITDERLTSGEIKASVVSDFIQEGLKEASEKFSDEKHALEKNVSEAQDLAKSLKQENEKIQNELKEAKDAVAALKAQVEAKKLEDDFNSRMAVIAEKFEMTESQEKTIAKDVKDLDSDEAFAAYVEKLSLFVAEKKKEEDKKESVASTKEVVSDAIDNGETKKEAVASQTSEGPSLAERFKSGFSVKVEKGKIKL